MRTLCLRFPRDVGPSAVESLLLFSPRVHYRAPGLAFVDITTSSRRLGGDHAVITRALEVAREFDPDATAAIADTPWGAQALSREAPNDVCLPRREFEDRLSRAPLARLRDYEGLVAWRSVAHVEKIIGFFKALGVKTLGDLRRFGVEAFRDRWGETGELIWMRLNGVDHQVISPLLPSDVLEDYVHLDFPVTSVDVLLRYLSLGLKRLLARLHGRGEYATVITTKLFCEYSDTIHTHELKPASPGRDFDLFVKLIEHKLGRLSLENPVRQIAIGVSTCPERVQQLSFFEPRVTDADKLAQLVSVFRQAALSTGFLRLHDEILPERAWSLTPEFEAHAPIDDVVERRAASFQVRPAHARGLLRAPRPSRLLRAPKALKAAEFDRYQLLSQKPIERLEDGWWDDVQGRDYYFARSPGGEFVWLYLDRSDRTYYVHGYFD